MKVTRLSQTLSRWWRCLLFLVSSITCEIKIHEQWTIRQSNVDSVLYKLNSPIPDSNPKSNVVWQNKDGGSQAVTCEVPHFYSRHDSPRKFRTSENPRISGRGASYAVIRNVWLKKYGYGAIVLPKCFCSFSELMPLTFGVSVAKHMELILKSQ